MEDNAPPFGSPSATGMEALRKAALLSDLPLQWLTLSDIDPVKRCLLVAKTLAAEGRSNPQVARLIESSQVMIGLKNEALARAGAAGGVAGQARSVSPVNASHAP